MRAFVFNVQAHVEEDASCVQRTSELMLSGIAVHACTDQRTEEAARKDDCQMHGADQTNC